MSKVYAVDFDGTLCESLYPKIGNARTEIIDYFKELRENGDKLILWTCRSGDLLDKAIEWCKEQGIEFDAINSNLESSIKLYKNDSRKVHADYYVDDKSFDMNLIQKRGEQMPFIKDREYRALVTPLYIPNEEKRIESDYYVEGFATTFDDPYLLWEYDGVKYFEVVDRNALVGADVSDIIMQYDHRGKVFARNSNKTLIVEPTNRGLFVCADLSKSQGAKDLYEEINSGLITKMSWAFAVAEESYNKDTRTRTILKIKKVYDVSAVSIPANPSTDISARSWLDGVIEAERQELLERERQKLIFQFNRRKAGML